MTTPSDIRRPTALVTGASSGIGAAFAHHLTDQGWHVIGVGRDRARLDELADTTGADVLAADLLTETGIAAVQSRVEAGVELLVNNAGYTTYGNFADLDLEAELGMLALHAEVPIRLSHAASRTMQRGGRIINIASLAGLNPAPGLASYAASKSALITFSQSLHHELRPRGITVTCICAGYTRTDLQRRAAVDASALPGALWTSPEYVARRALRGSDRGRAMVVPGLLNTISAVTMRLMPRRSATSISASIIGQVRNTD